MLVPGYDWYEWFRILIGMNFGTLLATAIMFIATYRNVLEADGTFILFFDGMSLAATLLYAFPFVIFLHFHHPLGDFLEQFGKLAPRVQRCCLRVSAYLYALFVIYVIFFMANARQPQSMFV